MILLVADENFDNRIVRGLLHQRPDLDILRVQDLGLYGADDPTVLEYAARAGRVMLTRDVSTMPNYGYERLEAGKSMPGLCVVRRSLAVGPAIEDILLLLDYTPEDKWQGQVRYVPL